MFHRLMSLLAVVLLVLGLCAGCGGGRDAIAPSGATAPTGAMGSVRIRIAWPTPGRVLPVDTRSIKVTLVSQHPAVLPDQEHVLSYPDASWTFEKVMAVDWILRAVAYDGAGGTGKVLASGEKIITVRPVVINSVGLTIDYLDHLRLVPGDITLQKGKSAGFTVETYDSKDQLVMVPTANITWTSAQPGVASVVGNGASASVAGVKEGTAVITVSATADGITKEATATVTVVEYPTPTLVMSAIPDTLTRGQSTTLTWEGTHATAVENSNFGATAVSGMTTVSPASTTLYTLRVAGPGGTADASVLVTVIEPLAITLTAAPMTIQPGNSTVLTWESSEAERVVYSNFGAAATQGTATVSPTDTTTYTLTLAGPGGETTARVTVTVAQLSDPPYIEMYASRAHITQGDPVVITWMTDLADTIVSSNFGAELLPEGEKTVWIDVTTTFTLTVSGPGGQATATATVTVHPYSDIYMYLGTAWPTTDGKGAHLVPETGGIGTWMYRYMQPVAEGFETEFAFRYYSSGDPSQWADGIAFALYTTPEIAPLQVDMDIYQNEWDPNDNHVDIYINKSLTTINSPVTLKDGNAHILHITYVPGALTIRLDGNTILTRNIDLTSFLPNGEARPAIYGRAYGLFCVHDVLSWTLTTTATRAARNRLSGGLGAIFDTARPKTVKSRLK